jgi:hypothetical protein
MHATGAYRWADIIAGPLTAMDTGTISMSKKGFVGNLKDKVAMDRDRDTSSPDSASIISVTLVPKARLRLNAARLYGPNYGSASGGGTIPDPKLVRAVCICWKTLYGFFAVAVPAEDGEPVTWAMDTPPRLELDAGKDEGISKSSDIATNGMYLSQLLGPSSDCRSAFGEDYCPEAGQFLLVKVYANASTLRLEPSRAVVEKGELVMIAIDHGKKGPRAACVYSPDQPYPRVFVPEDDEHSRREHLTVRYPYRAPADVDGNLNGDPAVPAPAATVEHS